MSKVTIYHAGAKDYEEIAQATVDAGFLPGMAFKFNNTGDAIEVADGNETMFVVVDAPDELKDPPTGKLATVVYGSGTKIVIDHAEEVASGNSDRAYAADVLGAGFNDDLYVGADGKWAVAVNGDPKAKVFIVPNAGNNYTLGLHLRF